MTGSAGGTVGLLLRGRTDAAGFRAVLNWVMIPIMSASGLPQHAKSSRPPDSSAVLHWLDALVSGSCTPEEVLHQVQRLERVDPEVAWEALARVDQLFRRRRISREIFVSLKAQLQDHTLGFGSGRAPIVQSGAQSVAPQAPTPLPAQAPAAGEKSDRPLRVGDVLRSRYRLIDVLGKDASGTLFEAMDELKIDKPGVRPRVAIRVLDANPQHVPELLRRVCSLQGLSHPGIARVFDVDAERGALFLTMEWLTGTSLRQLVEQNGGARLALPVAQTIIRTLAGALAYAHSQDVFHGDVGAGNVFITDAGEVRLQGFDIKGKGAATNAKADRLAFAWLAYGLLSGGAGNAPLREPPGLTREQWRVLRDTITGKEASRAGNVLTAFAGDGNAAAGRVSLLQAFAHTPARRVRFGDWLATAIVAAILAVAGYFLATQGASPVPRKTAEPAAASAAVPQVAAAQATADDVAIEDVAATKNVAAAATAPPAAPAPRPSRALIDLPSGIMRVAGDEPFARIRVRRRGGLSGAVTFLWWTESGTAQIGRDFLEISPRAAAVAEGANGVELLVPLLPNPSSQRPLTFYVKIDEASEGATLGEQTLMQIAIVPPGYEEAPQDSPL